MGYNNEMHVKESGCELAWDRVQWQVLVNTTMNLWVPQNARSFFTRLITIS